jgi:hypothetical protein
MKPSKTLLELQDTNANAIGKALTAAGMVVADHGASKVAIGIGDRVAGGTYHEFGELVFVTPPRRGRITDFPRAFRLALLEPKLGVPSFRTIRFAEIPAAKFITDGLIDADRLAPLLKAAADELRADLEGLERDWVAKRKWQQEFFARSKAVSEAVEAVPGIAGVYSAEAASTAGKAVVNFRFALCCPEGRAAELAAIVADAMAKVRAAGGEII